MPFSAFLNERGISHSFKAPEEAFQPYFYAAKWNMSTGKPDLLKLEKEFSKKR